MHHSPLVQAVLPLRSVVVTLRWLYNSSPSFMHHAQLHAWVRYLAGSPEGFSHQIVVEPLENGHIHYQKDELYRFRLTFIKGSETLIQNLLKALQDLPNSVPVKARQSGNAINLSQEPHTGVWSWQASTPTEGRNGPFAGMDARRGDAAMTDVNAQKSLKLMTLRQSGPFGENLVLESITDSFEHNAVASLADLSLYDVNDLSLETALWSRNPIFKIAFTTPARLIKPKAERLMQGDRQRDGGQRFCRDKADLTWPLFTQRLMDTLIHLYQENIGERLQRLDWPEAILHSGLAFWVKQNYRNTPNSKQYNKKTTEKDLSGVMAQLQLELPDDFPAELLALVVLGQYTGIGQSRAFGLGQYQLQDAYGIASHPRPQAAQTLLARSMSNQALRHACYEMYPRHADFESSETDEEHHIAVDSHMSALLNSQQAILSGHYQAGGLHPVEIDKPDGGTRLLSVPSWHERTLQKAVTEQLSTALDNLWMKHSYGYRKGHSRLNARDQINKYIQQGYHWVLESDIESFFDSVNWLNLEQRLKLMFPNEPLVPLLMQWVSAAKELEDGSQQARHSGLPQGAPISPILANLLLDDLDQDMLAKGHNIIRYADDFVLLFKTEDEAKAALADIHTSLNEHGLAINLDKTRIVEASQGFRYLGYLFIDGYAIETKRDKAKVTQTPHLAEEKALAEAKERTDMAQAERPEHGNIGERDKLGSLLTIAGDIAMLSHEKARLIVEQYDERHSYPWSGLSAVLLIGPHHITTPALRRAMQAGVPVHYANSFGQYQGVSTGAEPSELGADFWLQQMQYLQQQANALSISQALILGRIDGIKSVIKRRDAKAAELTTIQRICQQIPRATDLDQLRGYEGQASKHLWAFFKRYLEPEWQFTGRNRRPPKDPVNAMLSLGYSFLYGVVDSLNRAVGLYPWQAALHQRHGNHHTLASDLMEPFRYLVERAVLGLINRRRIAMDDFANTEHGCQMSSEARKTLLHELLVQLTQTSPKQDSSLNQIRDQSYRLAISCKTGQDFQAWSPKK